MYRTIMESIKNLFFTYKFFKYERESRKNENGQLIYGAPIYTKTEDTITVDFLKGKTYNETHYKGKELRKEAHYCSRIGKTLEKGVYVIKGAYRPFYIKPNWWQRIFVRCYMYKDVLGVASLSAIGSGFISGLAANYFFYWLQKIC